MDIKYKFLFMPLLLITSFIQPAQRRQLNPIELMISEERNHSQKTEDFKKSLIELVRKRNTDPVLVETTIRSFLDPIYMHCDTAHWRPNTIFSKEDRILIIHCLISTGKDDIARLLFETNILEHYDVIEEHLNLTRVKKTSFRRLENILTNNQNRSDQKYRTPRIPRKGGAGKKKRESKPRVRRKLQELKELLEKREKELENLRYIQELQKEEAQLAMKQKKVAEAIAAAQSKLT